MSTSEEYLLISTLPIQCPPVLPDVDQVLEQFLTKPEVLDIHNLERSQRFIPRIPRYESCYSTDVTPVQTVLQVERNQATGQLLGFYEDHLVDVAKSSKNSTSLNRLPGSVVDGIFGSTTNYPFWPGGLDEPDLNVLKSATESGEFSVDFINDLLTCPPGFKSGVYFPQRKFDSVLTSPMQSSIINIADILNASTDIDLGSMTLDDNQTPNYEKSQYPTSVSVDVGIDEIIKPSEQHQSKDSTTVAPVSPVVEDFAVMVDISKPVVNFHKLIPKMAFEWEFELDTFQKQAVLHLEKGDNVFVAAHTSAGKTVIAEYAIALAMQHMTKAIYTSPIKALSNQKFRDFKETFVGKVGLVTGDVQIKPEADCLIMTTEILRSMLYRGSDVIRDLEWVIFDEVHYINDAERGVVWEEVLIMLPQHVKIVMLSATVPNTKEFADWVGRTKRKSVYVVSTAERPIPLEHYLYTGNSNKTSNELFLLLDGAKNFHTAAYNKAVEAKKERASKSSQSYGAKGSRHGATPQQEKNIWLSVIDMLKKRGELPAVAFIFSKKRIEETTNHLGNVDLIENQKERSHIHTFFENSISLLKGSDKNLPQVLRMKELLRRGIGMHHSGILPILKEVVEMLFQKGLVKILFATETFAMGVNMPARTVVFDTMRKHDGTSFRDLLPGEYVQMAGRAGRRGKDSTGTVILLCKGDVPEMADLHRMLLGKPTKLESQFRLTYSMILNLLRVEKLRMEDMIKRSFGEFHTQKDTARNADRLKEIELKLKNLPLINDYSGDLQSYYDSCDEYFRLQRSIQAKIFGQHIGSKALCPGRIVILDMQQHRNTLAVILQGPVKDKNLKALVLCEATPKPAAVSSVDDWSVLPRPVLEQYLIVPEGQCSQALVSLTVEDIAVVSSKVLKINADKILDDVKKREQPRFRSDPPGQSTQMATQELMRLAESNANGLPSIDPVSDLRLQDLDLVQDVRRLEYLKDTLPTYRCVHDINFADNFRQLRSNVKMQEEGSHLKILLSDSSLALLPEYQQRVKVLENLHYVNHEAVVQLKGRVACELTSSGGHELLVTELIFSNAFRDLGPAELAAMLSSVVCHERRCQEPNLTPLLVKCRTQFLKIAEGVANEQKKCGVPISVEEYCESLHFGLTEVVFEWARGMPFCKLIELTDVQEGIVVRCIQQLDEILRDLRSASRIVGDPVLQRKAEDASCAIKRDIVFAASLYTQ